MSEEQDNFATSEDEETQHNDIAVQMDDDILSAVEEPKTPETQNSAIADDSVKIYLQQIGKIKLLTSEEELEVADHGSGHQQDGNDPGNDFSFG